MSSPTRHSDFGDAPKPTEPEMIWMKVTPKEQAIILAYRASNQDLSTARQQGNEIVQETQVTVVQPITGPSVFTNTSSFAIAGGSYAAVGRDQNIGVRLNVDQEDYSSNSSRDFTNSADQAPQSSASGATISMFSNATGFSIGGGDFVAVGRDYNSNGYMNTRVFHSAHIPPSQTLTAPRQPAVFPPSGQRPRALVMGPSVLANASNVEISDGTAIAPGALSAIGRNQNILYDS